MRERLHVAPALERLGYADAATRLRTVRADALAHVEAARYREAWTGTLWWLREPRGRRSYRVLSEAELLATRRSDTAFVFGSGGSLRQIAPDEWERIGRHDTVGFSHFHRQRWVDVSYHLVAEVNGVEETAASIRTNPRYSNTVFLVGKGWMAQAPNELVARRLLPQGARIFRWRRVARGLTVPPSPSLRRGFVHGSNSSLDVVNFALVMGWKRVVVVGVDLYDRSYFFLDEGETRPDEREGWHASMPFHQADHVVSMFGLWRRHAEARGVELSVYSPRSLLAQVLPVFTWDG